MTLQEVRDVFSSVLENVFHFEATNQSENYLVWAEEGQVDGEYADDEIQIQVIEGTADYFTKQEYDPLVKKIQKAMDKSNMSWKLNSIQFEKGTGYTHYEWVWRVGEVIG